MLIEDVLSRLFYRKSQRISSEKDFARVLARRCVVRRGMMRLYSAPNELSEARFGVSVSKSVGPAIVRNRVKRLAREVFRLNQNQIEPGFDFILIVSQPRTAKKDAKKSLSTALKLDYREFEKKLMDMMAGLKQVKVSERDKKESDK